MNPSVAASYRFPVRNTADTLALSCPECRSRMGYLPHRGALEDWAVICDRCTFQLRQTDGIWQALDRGREAHYAKFIADYEKIRAAEGRESRNAEFYLALPYRDLSGRNQHQWDIRSKTFDALQLHLITQQNRPIDILDLGAGNGWLSYRLSLNGHRCVAVDLLTNPWDGLGAARHYRSRLPHLFTRFRAELDRLPFEDAQFDMVIFNASFHYSEDYRRTLAESLRCLRRPGTLVIADTPCYTHEESGHAMLLERAAAFQSQYGFRSDSLGSQEFLTAERLDELAREFHLQWNVIHPKYGLRWAMRPIIAALKRRREPSQFRIYFAEVSS